MGLIYSSSTLTLMLANHYAQTFAGNEYIQFLNSFRAFKALQVATSNGQGRPKYYIRNCVGTVISSDSNYFTGNEYKLGMGFPRLMSPLSVFASLYLSVLAIIKPESPKVFTSLAQNARNLPLYVQVTVALLHLLINTFSYYFICLHTCVPFSFSHMTFHTLFVSLILAMARVIVTSAGLRKPIERSQYSKRDLRGYTATGSRSKNC